MPIIVRQAAKETSLFTDGFRTYLADLGYKKHHRIKHSTMVLPGGSLVTVD